MKVGLRYSRCVRDIVDGTVDINDVLVIVARTDFDPKNDEQWSGIWNGYGGGVGRRSSWSNPEWANYGPEREADFREVSIALLEKGKLHQPRQFGAHPSRLPYYWLDTFAPYEEIANNPATVSAWEKYKMLAGLSTKTQTVKDDF
jgi:hypothetical protein